MVIHDREIEKKMSFKIITKLANMLSISININIEMNFSNSEKVQKGKKKSINWNCLESQILIDNIIRDQSKIHMTNPQLLKTMKSKKCELEAKLDRIYNQLCCQTGGNFKKSRNR